MGKALTRHPKVYFEEWDDPQISAIGWVSELIGIAGGVDISRSARRVRDGARTRVLADPLEVVRRAPDIIVGSWCGKKFRPAALRRGRGGARSPRCATASCTR